MTSNRTSRTALGLACLSLVLWAMTVGRSVLRPTPGEPTASKSRLLDIIRREKVVRAAYVLNPPQVQRDATTGELSGYHIDLLREIMRQADARVEFEETTFANMPLALEGRDQIVVGGGFVSVDRATKLAFSEPIFSLGLGYLCRKDDQRFRSVDDLRLPKLKIAFAAGSASEEFVRANLPDVEPVILARGELAGVALAVVSRRADVGIFNQAQCVRFEREQPELRYPTRGKPFHPFASSLTLRQGDPDGLTFMNTALRTLRTNGFLDKLEKRYNPEGLYWSPLRP